MKDEDPFNPAVPADFMLLTENGVTESGQQPPESSADPRAEAKYKRRPNRSRQSAGPPGGRKRKRRKIHWPRMKEKLNAMLGGLDRNKLKTALVACGIAGGVVIAIVAAVKMAPIAVVLLALLGLACVIRIWDRLRQLPEQL